MADQWAVDAATREHRASMGGGADQAHMAVGKIVSRAFLKLVLRRRAIDSWKDEIKKRSRGRRPYQTPRRGEIPRIPGALQSTPKELATRFFQLASGHAMIAPFLKEKFGWVESDSCWWCSGGRQS